VLAWVLNVSQLNAAAPTPNLSGCGLTWELVSTVTIGALNDRRLSCFRAMGAAPTAGPLTISFPQNQDLCAWSVFEYDGRDMSGSNGSGAVARVLGPTTVNGTALSVAVPTPAAADSILVGGIALDLFSQVKPVTPDPEFAEISQELPNQTLGKSGTLQTQDKTGTTASVDWTWTGAVNAGAIVLELKAAPVITPTPGGTGPGTGTGTTNAVDALVRRFEPILYFHHDEKFFPADAKRYIEHAALWKAAPPFDSKGGWVQLVGKDKLAALHDEAAPQGDTPLDDPPNLVETGTEDHFFELAGWKDKTGMAQPVVDATSQNTYAERDAIATMYNNDDASGGRRELRDSRFWYHAELFDTKRLLDLVREDRVRRQGPDLEKLLAGMKNPQILCYYFFFPAHDEPLKEPGCVNVEAQELQSFAGQWSCYALLLERDSDSDPPRASYVGESGSRLTQVKAPDGSYVFPPFAWDQEKRYVIKANRFKPGSGPQAALPETIDDHAKLFVALGTHSFYLTSGSHDVSPWAYGKSPQQCGQYDTPADLPPDDDGIDVGDVVVVIAKLLINPLLGMVLLAAEDYIPWPGEGIDLVGTADVSEPEESPAPGSGKTVRPKGLTVPDAGSDVQDWAAAQNSIVAGRTYDFLVDRSRQPWWPSEDGKPSYQGRWGPRVENDKLPRRSGMFFPEFWLMFLEAIANLQANPVVGP
jgi:hypothetical protein